MLYVDAFAASLQSKAIGCATVAWSAGLTRLGADGVGGGAVETTVRGADIVMLWMADTVTVVVDGVVVVVTVNVALSDPPGTVTVAGTPATELLENNCTTVPPGGAALSIVTVPVDGLPPLTLVGLNAIDRTQWFDAGVTVSGAPALEGP